MDRELYENGTGFLVLSTISLIIIGCIVIGSATHVNREGLQLTGFGIKTITILWIKYHSHCRSTMARL